MRNGPLGEAIWESKIKEMDFESLKDASRTFFWRPLGTFKSFQTHDGTALKTELTSKPVLERFWDTSELDFGVFFQLSKA